jgi:hypothetical protein
VYADIGEVFVDGQNINVWCNSKKPITDLKMYNNPSSLSNSFYATEPSSFSMGYDPSDTNFTLRLQYGSNILPSHQFNNEFFLCE